MRFFSPRETSSQRLLTVLLYTGASLVTAFTLQCDWSTRLLMEPRERVLRQLDSLDIARQQCRRRGQGLEDIERRIATLRDSLNRAGVADSAVASSSPTTDTKPVAAPSRERSRWLTAIVALLCLAALALAGIVIYLALRSRATQPRRRKPSSGRQPPPGPTPPPAAPQEDADEDPVVRMVRTRLRTPVVKPQGAPAPRPPENRPPENRPPAPQERTVPPPRKPSAPKAPAEPKAAAAAPGDAPVADIRQAVLEAARAGHSPEQIAHDRGLSPDHVRLILKISGDGR